MGRKKKAAAGLVRQKVSDYDAAQPSLNQIQLISAALLSCPVLARFTPRHLTRSRLAGSHTCKQSTYLRQKRRCSAAVAYTDELQEVNSGIEMSHVVITTSNVSWGCGVRGLGGRPRGRLLIPGPRMWCLKSKRQVCTAQSVGHIDSHTKPTIDRLTVALDETRGRAAWGATYRNPGTA